MKKKVMGVKKIIVDDVQFHIAPLRPLTVLKITKQLVQLSGAIAGTDKKSSIFVGISNALKEMEDEAFIDLCLLILSSTSAVSSEGPVPITNRDSYDIAFVGFGVEHLITLLFEVLKHNQLPLVRDIDLDIGDLIAQISGSVKDEDSSEVTETSTDNQENSPMT